MVMDPVRIEAKANIDAKLDINEALSISSKTSNKLLAFIFGDKYIDRLRKVSLGLAQIEADEQKVISGEALFDLDSNSLDSLAASHIESSELSNIANCLKHALPLIKDSNYEEIDDSIDFINRWRSEAKLISRESIREVWGRVLAQEINDSNSISLRSLDIIKNLSKLEAESFLLISKYVLFDQYVVDNKQDLNREHFVNCRDSGLIISFTPGMYRSTNWPEINFTKSDNNKIPVYYIRLCNYFIYMDKDSIAEGDVPSFCYWELSAAGKELYKILKDDIDIGKTELTDVLKCIKDNFLKNVRYTKYTNIEKNEIDIKNIKSYY